MTCESDDSNHAQVVVAAATAGTTFDFGMLTMGKAHILRLWRPARKRFWSLG
jgi:hypothetical protein